MDNLSFEEAQVSAFRTHRHHLDLRAPRSRLPSVVADVCGVQAQVTAMARIALWARLRHLTVDDVEQALVQKRNIVKTWSMRGALHLLASNELLLYLSGCNAPRIDHVLTMFRFWTRACSTSSTVRCRRRAQRAIRAIAVTWAWTPQTSATTLGSRLRGARRSRW